jgi:hypothetical protein
MKGITSSERALQVNTRAPGMVDEGERRRGKIKKRD